MVVHQKRDEGSFSIDSMGRQVPMRAWIMDRVLRGSIGRIGERKKSRTVCRRYNVEK